MKHLGRTTAIMALFALALTTAGCDDDDGRKKTNPASTSTPTATTTPTVTPTPEHHGPPHSIMRIGSTVEDGGALTVDEVPIAFVVASACLGGSGDDCIGGTVVYSETSPGFNELEADDPNLPIYILPDGIEVSVEITAIDPDASVLLSGVLLDQVGETAVVNTTPHLHNHPTWQMVAPGGELPADRQISFRLLAEGFAPSEIITVTLRLFEGEGGHDHD